MLMTFKIYGMVEVVTGSIKLICLAIIICILIAINRGGEYLPNLFPIHPFVAFSFDIANTISGKLDSKVSPLDSNVSQMI